MNTLHLNAVIAVAAMWVLWWMMPPLGWLWLFLIMLLSGYTVYRLRGQFAVIVLVAFTLPLSVEVPIFAHHKWFFPSEALLSICAVSLVLGMWTMNQPKRDWFPLLWLLSFLPGVMFSENPIVSLKFMLVNLTYVVVFYYGIHYFSLLKRPLTDLYKMYFLALVPVVSWAIWQFVGFEFNPVTLPGIFKPFYNDHTIVGAVLAFLSGVFLVFSERDKRYLMIAIVLIAGVFFTGSRAAIISVMVMFVVYGALQFALLRKLLPLGVVLLAAGLWMNRSTVISVMAQNTAGSREQAVGARLKSSTNVTTDASNLERLNRWLSAWRMFVEKPHTGFGPGMYQFSYIPFQDDRFRNRLTVTNPDNPPPGSGGTAHSELLLQLSEAGWLPVVMFLAMLARWVFYGWRASMRHALMPKAALLGLTTYLFHMHFNNFLTTDAFAFLFWSSGALMMHRPINDKDE